MHWMQALVFCGGLIYAAVDDIKTRKVSDLVCLIIAMAGLIDISLASVLGFLVAGLPFYLGAGLGKCGAGDTRLAAAAGLVLGCKRAMIGTILFIFAYALFIVIASLVHWLRYKQPFKSCPLVPIIAVAFIPAYFM